DLAAHPPVPTSRYGLGQRQDVGTGSRRHASWLAPRPRRSVAPFPRGAVPGRAAGLVSLPLPTLQEGRDAHLVGAIPLRRFDAERLLQHLADGDVGERRRPGDVLIPPVLVAAGADVDAAPLASQPALDPRVPGVGFVARLLLGGGGRDQLP